MHDAISSFLCVDVSFDVLGAHLRISLSELPMLKRQSFVGHITTLALI